MPSGLPGFLRRNWFLLGLLAVLALAFLFPQAARVLDPGAVTRTILIVILFVIAGFTLPTESIRSGLRDWRLHLLVQGFQFVLTPLWFFLSSLPLRGAFEPSLLAGVFALAAVPTTISSCIVFTQVSGGNVMGTLFNSALSNLLGVFVSPLLLALLLRGSGRALPLAQLAATLRDLVLQILAPLAAGQILRRFLPGPAAKARPVLAQVSNALLLGVVYLTFARSAGDPSFLGHLRGSARLFAYLAGSHLLLVGLAWALARAWRFPRENVISVLFAAPQKTLAMGAPLVTAYFARSPGELGLLLLPLLLYHPWQLLVAGFLRNGILSGRLLRAR